MELDALRIGGVNALRQFIKLAGNEIRLRFVDRNTAQDQICLGWVLLRPGVVEIKKMHKRKMQPGGLLTQRTAISQLSQPQYHYS